MNRVVTAETVEQVLARLIAENPGMPMMAYADEDMLASVESSRPRVPGEIRACAVQHVVQMDEDVWIREEDEDELLDLLACDIEDEMGRPVLSDDAAETVYSEAQRRFRALNWQKRIVLYILA